MVVKPIVEIESQPPVELDNLDPSIFRVESSTTPNDKQSLLRMQKIVRDVKDRYAYLEIGSYRGGSLLPYLHDPRCELVVSIDKRPDFQADERALNFSYEGITTADMISGLSCFAIEAEMAKLKTFDADATGVSAVEIGRIIDVALIDGEHTNIATSRDFFAIFPLLADDAIVIFHDVNLVADAFKILCLFLVSQKVEHVSFVLRDVVGVIALSGMIEPARQALSGVALEQQGFFVEAKRVLREQIATSVVNGQHLGVA